MEYAIKRNDNWEELPVGRHIVIDDMASSYETMASWPEDYRAELGIASIESDEVPEGKIAVGSSLQDRNGKPFRVWILEDEPVFEPEQPESVFVVSKAQAKLALLEAGLLDTVETALGAIKGIEGQRARIEWNDRTEFHRDHEFIALLAVSIGLSDEQIDALFTRASQL